MNNHAVEIVHDTGWHDQAGANHSRGWHPSYRIVVYAESPNIHQLVAEKQRVATVGQEPGRPVLFPTRVDTQCVPSEAHRRLLDGEENAVLWFAYCDSSD